ncbi:dTMP kinase [Candidatus Woesebacteria bacterium]|nr:dTMP kinase [Candidatus Woesebacteria bacterium]
MNNYPGKVITFEGPEGSGKTTQIAMLIEHLRNYDPKVAKFREPGGDEFSEKIRGLLLDKNHLDVDYKSELMLFMAARAQFVSRVLVPHLKEGYICLIDRFIDSSVAYQGVARQQGQEWVETLNRYVTGGLIPDITFLLDLGPEIGVKRKKDAGVENRLDLEKIEFHRAARQGYLFLLETDISGRWVKIDGNLSAEAIHKRVCKGVWSRLHIGWNPEFESMQPGVERYF